ncbi:hypothetical protein B0H10DRAFT_2243718 [Mycena sp. CBHHK59/15]|nr:hypothetical protein B0H10DRAFT_2243718 [Mycena sp. CBHHK59/15]
MSLLPNAGVLAPIPDIFDFDMWTTPPPSKNPTGRTLRLRNQHNLTSERFNELIDWTLNCKEDRAAHLDVGPPLKFFYAYMAEEMSNMILSEAYCTDVGPLPAFIRGEVKHARRKKTECTEADKAEREKTKGRPLKGVMILSNPIVRVPGQQLAVVVPDAVLQSILHKLYVPLHCPDKVLVFDMLKMIQADNWGSDEQHSCMSPLTWQQAAMNLEAALNTLSEEVVVGAPDRVTFVTEFRKHRLFFTNYEKFEDNYLDWYSFKREARHSILWGFVFDGSDQVQIFGVT